MEAGDRAKGTSGLPSLATALRERCPVGVRGHALPWQQAVPQTAACQGSLSSVHGSCLCVRSHQGPASRLL